MTTERSDQHLAGDAARGDLSAFELLVRRYTPLLLAFCTNLMQDRTEAEDRVQESFVKAFRSLRQYDPNRSFRSWMYKIAQNACIDALRSRKKWEDLPGPESVPDSMPITPDHLEQLHGAIGKLPDSHRLILDYKFRLGLNSTEIAEQLEMTPQNVRISLHRAIRLLRERLNP